ncbi:flagellar motor switch protein FliM [Solicola sp. PLA-1-18]|uniref:flagellar motor switch protein FliM n=1 Tax=Solicola sp. PLA-1-18 TaxID=3380532 RepID=UPI003B7883FC
MTFSGTPSGRSAVLSGRLAPTGVAPYDFSRPVQLSREHARVIEGCLEGFARQAATVLTTSLRTICQVGLRSLEQMTYVEYVDTLDEQTHLSLVSLEPLAQPAIWQLPFEALMTWVDLLLGGHGRGEQPDRSLSEIETAVVSGLMAALLEELRSSLDPVVSTTPALAGVSFRPRLAHLVPNVTVLVVATFALRQGDRETTTTLALPFASLLPHLSAQGRSGELSERERASRDEAAVRLAGSIQDVPLDVGVRCRPTTVAPHELVGLQVGDVVRLQHPADAPLDVMGGDVLFAHGTPGTRGQSLACLVIAPTSQEPA